MDLRVELFFMIQPKSGQSYEDFVISSHSALMNQIPDADTRNRVVWNAWDASNNGGFRTIVDAKFSPSEFEVQRDCCHFVENESAARDASGQPVTIQYNAAALADIAKANNSRIFERSSFPNVTVGHNPTYTPPGKVKEQPDTIGYIGPLKLGMIGQGQQVWGLFADEYRRKDSLDRFAKCPNRSVEIIRLNANGQRYIGNVAALSEASRLPLPTQFSAGVADESYCESCFSMAFMTPGPGNTRMASFDTSGGQPTPTAPSPGPDPQQGGEDAIVAKFIKAISETGPFVFLTNLMQMTGGDPSKLANGQSPQPQDLGQQPPTQPQPAQPSPQPPQQPSQQFGGAVPMKYSALSEEDMSVTVEQYAALQQQTESLMTEVASLRSEVAFYSAEAADAERRLALGQLASAYPAAQIDLETEYTECLYSAGSTLNDEQFQQRLSMIERYASKIPSLTPAIPMGSIQRPKTSVETHQFSADQAIVARDIFSAACAKGQKITQEEAYRLASEQMASTRVV